MFETREKMCILDPFGGGCWQHEWLIASGNMNTVEQLQRFMYI